ncbi:hypothetical protein AVEN_60823-1 [Araneus ventricosus]|uniref:Uncharacterized protein n=1 Tax=Araneus ventricosus TaxID=182803 RepID=A0A4Y2SGR2_ARAVE|nr:hypothetical protein AVEN_60823-1 [Araneus ventricosus]
MFGRERRSLRCWSIGAESHIPSEEITHDYPKEVSVIHHRRPRYHTTNSPAVNFWDFTSLPKGGTRSRLRSSGKTEKVRILPRRRVYPRRFRSQRHLSRTICC